MPCDTESLSDIECYVCGNFLEVSTATESDVASGHPKGPQTFYAVKLNNMNILYSYASYISRLGYIFRRNSGGIL